MKYWKPAFVVCVLLLTAFLYSAETKKDIFVTDIEHTTSDLEGYGATIILATTVCLSDGAVYYVEYGPNGHGMQPNQHVTKEVLRKCLLMAHTEPRTFKADKQYSIFRL